MNSQDALSSHVSDKLLAIALLSLQRVRTDGTLVKMSNKGLSEDITAN